MIGIENDQHSMRQRRRYQTKRAFKVNIDEDCANALYASFWEHYLQVNATDCAARGS
jgi:hypothetical protein